MLTYDAGGRPSNDRNWNECFAQLVGTVLSLWDAADLDAAGDEGTVMPTFINLADASIKMIESLPMNGPGGQSLNNVLSISTAANNRYLLHFNSLNSLTQWTAGIRLAIFEHSLLQESYTGSLIAGKGKLLNNMRQIMERSNPKFPTEDWARVRFGAGTPWRRCWFVIQPPAEKESKKLEKALKKNGGSVYDRPSVVKGDLKFYDTRKVTKKTRPIATIKNAYSAYAIYPQSKPLIDQSTLVKIEGDITIHSQPETTTEGFVFVMPEVHPAVSGFEMMLRFLFPLWDSFALYGRPTRLDPDTNSMNSLMFAMPKERRYGYLELLDVSGLIHEDGSGNWNERKWRKSMKELTLQRMNGPSRSIGSRASQHRKTGSQVDLPRTRASTLRFDDGGQTTFSQPGSRTGSPGPDGGFRGPRRIDTAPQEATSYGSPRHQRSISEATNGYKSYQPESPSRLSFSRGPDPFDRPPPPPEHRSAMGDALGNTGMYGAQQHGYDSDNDGYTSAPEGDYKRGVPERFPDVEAAVLDSPPPAPVAAPPAFGHAPSQKPPTKPYQPYDMQKAQSQMDAATLSQLQDANANASFGTAGPTAAGAMAWAAGNGSGGARNNAYDRSADDRGQRLNYAGVSNNGLSAAPSNGYFQGRSQQASPMQGGRLPTIPASPYIDQTESSPAPHHGFEPAAPPVPEHGEILQQQQLPYRPAGSPNENAYGDMGGVQTPGSVNRKPVPGRSTPSRADDAVSTTSNSSLGSLRKNVIDLEALDRLPLNHDERSQSLVSNNDAASDVSPDYASTASVASKKSEVSLSKKPRMGQLKTVGKVIPPPPEDIKVGDVQYTFKKEEEPKIDIPAVDFGKTYNIAYGQDKRPGTSGTITPSGLESRPKSRQGLMDSPGENGIGSTLGKPKRESYFGGGRVSPNSPGTPGEIRSRSKSPGPSAAVNLQTQAKNIYWQPPVAGANRSESRQSVNAEEWVQQRAALAQQMHSSPRSSPITAHTRNSPSGGTPPISRTASGDWSALGQRTPSRERIPSRPQSRGAGSTLNLVDQIGTGRPHSRAASTSLNVATTPGGTPQLSAKEQQYVSRVTGAPLVQLDRRGPREAERPQSSAGLIGAIAAREKEKQDVKSYGRSALVNDAIAANMRQQQMVEQQQYQQQILAQQQQFQHMQQMQQLQLAQQQQMMMQQAMPGAYSPSVYTPRAITPGGSAMSPVQQQQYGYGFPTQQQLMGQLPYGGMGNGQQMQQQVPRQAYGASADMANQSQQQQQQPFYRPYGGGR